MLHLPLRRHVVLTSREVPHQIAQIHIADLIRHQPLQVLQHRGAPRHRIATHSVAVHPRHRIPVGIESLRHVHPLHRRGVHPDPRGVAVEVERGGPGHSREQHVELRSRNGANAVSLRYVTGLSRIGSLKHGCVDGRVAGSKHPEWIGNAGSRLGAGQPAVSPLERIACVPRLPRHAVGILLIHRLAVGRGTV